MKRVEAVNIFGEPIVLEVSTARRKPTVKRGYAALPGTGPAGETCKTCRHAKRFGGYSKCGLQRNAWTGGEGTDILLKSPACRRWESVHSKEKQP